MIVRKSTNRVFTARSTNKLCVYVSAAWEYAKYKSQAVKNRILRLTHYPIPFNRASYQPTERPREASPQPKRRRNTSPEPAPPQDNEVLIPTPVISPTTVNSDVKSPLTTVTQHDIDAELAALFASSASEPPTNCTSCEWYAETLNKVKDL